MKKLTILSMMFCTSLIMGLSSCGGPKGVQSSILQANYRGAMHRFNSATGMRIYQGAGYSTVQAEESGTSSTISLFYVGIDTGTYVLGGSSGSSLSVTVSGTSYSSQSSGSHGTIGISSLDAGSTMAIGTFSGTFYNTNTHSDSLSVTQGTISVKYQFN